MRGAAVLLGATTARRLPPAARGNHGGRCPQPASPLRSAAITILKTGAACQTTVYSGAGGSVKTGSVANVSAPDRHWAVGKIQVQFRAAEK